MSDHPEPPRTASQFADNLRTLRRRLLITDSLRTLLLTAWVFPLSALLPAFLVITFTSARPVPIALLLYCLALMAAAILPWLRGLSPLNTARRLDASFNLNERLATAVELSRSSNPGRIAPLVLDEALADSDRLRASPMPVSPLKLPLIVTLVSLALLLATAFLPARWLPRLIEHNRQQTTLNTAAELLNATANQLHANSPDLPGVHTTQIRLEIEDLAHRLARRALTPDETRDEVKRMQAEIDALDTERIQASLDRDLTELERARLLRKIVEAVRRGDPDGARSHTVDLSQKKKTGMITDQALIDELKQALTALRDRTDRPGLAEAAGRLRDSFDNTTNDTFGKSLDNLTDTLLATAADIQNQRTLKQDITSDLRRLTALLEGKSTGTPTDADAASRLLANPTDLANSDAVGSTAAGPGSLLPSRSTSRLARHVLDASDLADAPAQHKPLQHDYRRYLRRYFTNESATPLP